MEVYEPSFGGSTTPQFLYSETHLKQTSTGLYKMVWFRQVFGLPWFKTHLNHHKGTLNVSGLDRFFFYLSEFCSLDRFHCSILRLICDALF